MKDYLETLTYMRMEKLTHSDLHQRYYEEAIEALDRNVPKAPTIKAIHIQCPVCDQIYTIKNKSEASKGERFCTKCGQYLKWKKILA